jgi:Tryptophan-rich sensory protein (mitochondrial benzodiazepine receptor homolog)
MYNTYMLKNKFLSFIIFFVITFSASFIGGLASISFKEPWYSQLIKSNYNPPDWIFAPSMDDIISNDDISYMVFLAHKESRYKYSLHLYYLI